ncbi:FimV/HubP family polar landmark protein [Saccharospirillum impatiens]|uniref:FimV/HubP family polar landmark protein n=1 Tax=Saccharospirillum impatiens TaxID=169438 RepID=UPI000416E727|nr:FimV/HubP family polar landmark protein [Saccharospirillum impatiens]
MFKKQALVFAISALAFTNVAQALGLGDIELNSNLNEPLDADIELTQLRGLTAGEIIPTLASNDAFVRAGIERSFFLSNIQFSLEENEAGDLIIVLETRQPVREPFLNFLVEVNWPGGRLLKEYTLLLDPPVFDTGVVGESLVIDPAAQQAPAPSREISTTTTVAQSSEETTPVPAATEPRQDNLAGDEYRVQRNDTLWEIAMQVPGRDGYNMQQVMLALQDVNPEAFLNDNINRLKAGSVLTFPTAEQMGRRSVQEAIREVENQNQGRAASARPTTASSEAAEVQLSATESTSSALPEQDGERDPDGYLEVSADGAEGTSAGGESVDQNELERLENELAIAGELNDQFERERDQLQGRVSELEEQLAIMERMINLQSGDAAAFQAELAGQAEEQAAQADVTESADAPIDGSDSSTAAPADQAAASEPAQPEPEVAAEPEPQPAPQPQPVVPPAPEPGVMGFVQQYTQPAINWVMASVTNMVAAAAALLVVLLLPFYLRSRRNNKEEESLVDLDDTDTADIDPGFDEHFEEDMIDGFDGEDDFDDLAAEESDATSDAVMEAEMYMAYQKYDQAEEKLKSAFAEQPNRSDIGLKLLEVYAETGNSAAFGELEKKLSLSAEQKSQVDEYRNRMPLLGSNESMSSELDDDDLDFGNFSADSDDLSSLEDESESDDIEYTAESEERSLSGDSKGSGLTLDSPGSEASSDLDFSLDLDDLELPESEGDDDGLDFDLQELGLDDEEPAAEKPKPASSELDFDFDDTDEGELSSDLDFSLDETSVEPEPELPKLEDDDDIDFDAEIAALDDDSTLESALPDELPTDDSLSLDSSTTEERAVDVPESSDALQDLADALPGEAELDDDEFDFLSGNDEASTKLDLARAYIEMDDKDGARDILEEVAHEGTDEQKSLAKELMDQL